MTKQKVEVSINLPIWTIARIETLAKKANIDALLSSFLEKVDKPNEDFSYPEKVDKPNY
jgi:hypothetical protein